MLTGSKAARTALHIYRHQTAIMATKQTSNPNSSFFVAKTPNDQIRNFGGKTLNNVKIRNFGGKAPNYQNPEFWQEDRISDLTTQERFL
jgi:hypothetical protein